MAREVAVQVSIVHDYLTQRGGAERVVLSMLRAFPGAPVHTSLYDRAGTYAELADADVRPFPLDRLRFLRAHHRAALPLLAPAFSAARIAGDVVLCSSSGWAHGVRTDGRKVVYCYSPAKWLYQPKRYPAPGRLGRMAMSALRPVLRRWDQGAAASADRYLVTSTVVQGWVRDAYGIDAEIVPPPGGVDPDGPVEEVRGLDAGFLLCVSRLLPYKNVAAVLAGAAARPDEQLVVVGQGPEAAALEAHRPANVTMVPAVTDAQLRWLYRSCSGLVTAAEEDYGLTPLEAGSFGKPVLALRWGGFVDTVVEGETGLFLEQATPADVARGITELRGVEWDPARISAHAAGFSEDRFINRLQAVVAEEARS